MMERGEISLGKSSHTGKAASATGRVSAHASKPAMSTKSSSSKLRTVLFIATLSVVAFCFSHAATLTATTQPRSVLRRRLDFLDTSFDEGVDREEFEITQPAQATDTPFGVRIQLQQSSRPPSAPAPAAWLDTTAGKGVLAEAARSVAADGAATAVAAIAAQMAAPQSPLAGSCHPLLHRVGRLAAETDLAAALAGFGISWGGTPAAVGGRVDLLNVCNAAVLHGLIEHYLTGTATPEKLQAAVERVETDLCGAIDAKPGHTWRQGWECRHGIGHGIVQFWRARSTHGTLDAALQSCAASSLMTDDCMNGVWMDHWASTRVMDGGDLDLDPAKALAVCSGRSAACVLYSPTAYLLHHAGDYVSAFGWCARACESNEDNLDLCTQGVGMQTAKENLQDYAFVEGICLAAGSEKAEEKCFDSALGYSYFADGRVKQPEDLCLQLKTERFRGTCRGWRGGGYPSLE